MGCRASKGGEAEHGLPHVPSLASLPCCDSDGLTSEAASEAGWECIDWVPPSWRRLQAAAREEAVCRAAAEQDEAAARAALFEAAPAAAPALRVHYARPGAWARLGGASTAAVEVNTPAVASLEALPGAEAAARAALEAAAAVSWAAFRRERSVAFCGRVAVIGGLPATPPVAALEAEGPAEGKQRLRAQKPRRKVSARARATQRVLDLPMF